MVFEVPFFFLSGGSYSVVNWFTDVKLPEEACLLTEAHTLCVTACVVSVWQAFMWPFYLCDDSSCDCYTGDSPSCLLWQAFMRLLQVWQAFMWLLYRCDSPSCDCFTGVMAFQLTVIQVWLSFMWLCDGLSCNCCTGMIVLHVIFVQVWQPLMGLLYRCDDPSCDL